MSNPFGESPYWRNFWQNKSIEKNVMLYALAPLFQEAAGLLCTAAHLWHPWSIKRVEELETLARSLSGEAATLRQRGLGWACQDSRLVANPSYILCGASHHRRYKKSDEQTIEQHPEATPYFVTAAVHVLFLTLEIFGRISEKEFGQRHWIPKISVMIEQLMESPCIGSKPEISNEMRRVIALRGIFAECEGLAYTMARIEDQYRFKHKTAKRKRSDLSDEQIGALADDLGVDFNVLKEMFETEHSSWRKISERYKKDAELLTANFFSKDFDIPQTTRVAMQSSWELGRTEISHLPDYFNEDEMNSAENVIKAFISMFLTATTYETNLSITSVEKIKKLLTAPAR